MASREFRLPAGALTVIHPFCDEFFEEAKTWWDDRVMPLSWREALEVIRPVGEVESITWLR